jgi:hypothetical protein
LCLETFNYCLSIKPSTRIVKCPENYDLYTQTRTYVMDFWLKNYMHRHFLKGTLFPECHHSDLYKVVVKR